VLQRESRKPSCGNTESGRVECRDTQRIPAQ
jgi:hypothetical protein